MLMVLKLRLERVRLPLAFSTAFLSPSCCGIKLVDTIAAEYVIGITFQTGMATSCTQSYRHVGLDYLWDLIRAYAQLIAP